MKAAVGTHSARLSTLIVYSYYRVFLAAALLLSAIVSLDRGLKHAAPGPDLYLLGAGGYFVLALVSSVGVRLFLRSEGLQGLLLVATDIVALSFLAYLSGSASGKVAPLLVVTVASGAILLQGRLSYVIAAAATLAMLYQQVLAALANGGSLTDGSTQAGLLGLAFFGVVAATNQLTNRVQLSEALVSQRSSELLELEQLNAHIIQRMRTGILVVDDAGVIRLSNGSALQMLLPEPVRHALTLEELSPELRRRILAWRADSSQRFPPFRNHAAGPEIDVSMTAVRIGERLATLVFLEDLAVMAQQLQQMKLASLGRLTASIAHEIRNPLSAINHAAQLLGEARLPPEDHRLTEIVQQQALRLDRIVENVLQLSRRQKPRTDLLELGSWLRQFRGDYLSTHPEGDELLVSADGAPQRVRFDPHHLQQILQNLCDNGLRHGRALTGKGQLSLVVVDGTPANEAPLLRIHDNGPGITAENVGNLFEPFFTTDAKGTGLGLYIARELCEANRARLAYVPAQQDERGYFQITFAHPGRLAS